MPLVEDESSLLQHSVHSARQAAKGSRMLKVCLVFVYTDN